MLAPGTRLGPFEILEQLGSGGMGEVYRARDTRLGRDVAVKVLPELLARNEEARTRLEREARSVAALSHPNIVAVHQFDFDPEKEIAFLATELLEGETLRSRLHRSAIGWRKSAEVGVAVAEALAAAHAKGVVHRDVKPENIFITSAGQIKVLDFGLARMTTPLTNGDQSVAPTDRLTSPGTVLGTINYMSPEQVRGETVGPTGDIFSLGCVLFEMIAGASPFQAPTAAETMAAILRAEPAEVDAKAGGIPHELLAIVRHCLEKNPEERFQSARDLAFDLKAIASSSSIARVSAGPGAIDSMAVLPFENASGDPETEYLSDGITETIISRLSQLPQLRVMARSTVFRYKGRVVETQEIGHLLNVRAVLTGRVMQRGDMLTIWTELVNVADGSQIWGERYHRKVADLIAIEEEIAREISEKLRIRLSARDEERLARPETHNTEAYQAYLKGRYHWNKRSESGVKKGIEFFNEALEKDPTYALAYVGLADSYHILAYYSLMPPDQAFPRAQAAARRALDLDPSLAEAHISLAHVLALYRWDWASAERHYRRGLELKPAYPTGHYWYSSFLIAADRLGEARIAMDRALELDPLSMIINAGSGFHAYMRREVDYSIEQLRKAIALDSSFALAHVWLSAAYRRKGMCAEALAEAEEGLALTDTKAIALEALASAQAAAGRREEAQASLDALVKISAAGYLQPYYLATIHAALGEHDQALGWLEKAFEQRSHFMIFLNTDPALDSLRTDARFTRLVEAIALGTRST